MAGCQIVDTATLPVKEWVASLLPGAAWKTSAKAQMERLSISIPPPQMAWLRAEADSLGVSLGELLRRIIDELRKPKN